MIEDEGRVVSIHVKSDCSSLERTTIQIMLTRTTLCAMLSQAGDWRFVSFTYKPAKVKMADSMICCLVVVRRRHKRGIGFDIVSNPGERIIV